MPSGKRIRHQRAAHHDLFDIWRYSRLTWGADQADHYLAEIDRAMQAIALGELVGVPHEYRYRKRRVGAHVVYYRENDREIVIVRVLHSRMDVSRHLAE